MPSALLCFQVPDGEQDRNHIIAIYKSFLPPQQLPPLLASGLVCPVRLSARLFHRSHGEAMLAALLQLLQRLLSNCLQAAQLSCI